MVPDQHEVTLQLQEMCGEKFCVCGGKKKIKADLKGCLEFIVKLLLRTTTVALAGLVR